MLEQTTSARRSAQTDTVRGDQVLDIRYSDLTEKSLSRRQSPGQVFPPEACHNWMHVVRQRGSRAQRTCYSLGMCVDVNFGHTA
jgi:hypothetical protein